MNNVLCVLITSIGALITAWSIVLLTGTLFIRNFKKLFYARAREYTPQTHRAKDGIPTMGGLILLSAAIISIVLWAPRGIYTWLIISSLISFGAIGFWDDWYKLQYKRGISEKHKSLAQLFCALVIITFWYTQIHPTTTLTIPLPFYAPLSIPLGLLLIPWSVFILVATSNAVNLTDGLDGLASGSLIPTYTLFGVITFLGATTHDTTFITLLPLISSIIGSLLGFLWYNNHPAQIFMGDVGALALGGTLGLIALITRYELLLALAGIIFVLETLSVMIQITSYRRFGKRLFKMAPIHHHFELSGFKETVITTRFTSISWIASLLALLWFITSCS